MRPKPETAELDLGPQTLTPDLTPWKLTQILFPALDPRHCPWVLIPELDFRPQTLTMALDTGPQSLNSNPKSQTLTLKL